MLIAESSPRIPRGEIGFRDSGLPKVLAESESPCRKRGNPGEIYALTE